MKDSEIKDGGTTISETPAESAPSAPQVTGGKGSEKSIGEPNEAFFGSVLLFCLALSLLAATGYFGLAGYRYFKAVQGEKMIPSIDSLPKSEAPVATKEEEMAAPEKMNPENPTPATPVVVIDKKTLVIKVLNGGSAKGVAGTYAEKLKLAGFSKTTVGNAFEDYTGQTLYYAKAQSAAVDVLKQEVMKAYPAVVAKEAPTGDKDANAAAIVLILGR